MVGVGAGLTSNANSIVIPQGKTLIIMRGKKKIPEGVDCVLEENITLTLSSTFAPILSGGIPTIAKIIAGAISDITKYDIPVGFKQFGYQLWQNTDPLSFSMIVAFYMNTNAKTDVYDPTMELIKLPLPEEIGTKGGLKAPGPSIFSLMRGKGGAKESILGREYNISKAEIISLSIGQLLYLGNVIIKNAEPTFSIETDERGYPIWSKIKLDISTVEIATVDMLQRSKLIPTSERGIAGR